MEVYKSVDIVSDLVMYGSPCLSCLYDTDGECAILPKGMCTVVEIAGNEFASASLTTWLPARGYQL